MPGSSRIVIFGDPQYAVTAQPSLFAIQIDWVVRNPPALVLFTGDCTDDDASPSWAIFAAGLAKFNAAGIPWMLVTGNHDYYPGTGDNPDRTTNLNAAVSIPAGVTVRQAGHLESGYATITLGGVNYLILCLEWSPRTATVAWAQGVIAANTDKPIFLVTHAFLYGDGTRFDQVAYGPEGQGGDNPHSAKFTTTPSEGIYDGQELWNALIKSSSNVRFVLSGHVSVAARRNDLRDDGGHCIQLLCDFQYEPWYDSGWLVELDVDNVNRILSARTYSPYLRQYRFFDSQSFREPF
jgi:hypothetical protein